MIVFIVGFCFLIIIGIMTGVGVKKYYENKDKKRLLREEQMKLNEKIKKKNIEINKEKEKATIAPECSDFEDWIDANHDTCAFYSNESYQKRCSNSNINPIFRVSVSKTADQTFLNLDELAPSVGKYENMPAYAACCECGGGADGVNFKKWCETNISPYCGERDNIDKTSILDQVIDIVTQEPTFVPQIEKTKELIKITDPPVSEIPTVGPLSFTDTTANAVLQSEINEKKDKDMAVEIDTCGNAIVDGAVEMVDYVYEDKYDAYDACKLNTDCIGWAYNKVDTTFTLMKKDNFIDGDIVYNDLYIIYLKK